MSNQPELFPSMQETELICITLWRPWADWVLLEWKTIETRLHDRFKNLVGKRIGIHAGLKWDKSAINFATPWLSQHQARKTEAFPDRSGRILCTVLIKEARWLQPVDSIAALIDCGSPSIRRFGLVLEDVQPFAAEIHAAGKQGIWKHHQGAPHDPAPLAR